MIRAGILAVFACALTAQAGSPRLESITPTGGQRGSELEVTFGGQRLEETAEIYSYEPGIQILKINSVTNKLVSAQLKIAPDCQLGEHHLRLRTASGLSDLMTFSVGAFPTLKEQEPNNNSSKAQKINLNTTVEGVITSEDSDVFSLEAQKGSRISVDVEGMRLGRGAFDSRVALLAADGAVVAVADDTWLGMQDPFLSVIAPSNGTYFVELREVTYGGNDNYHYRLHIGSFPRPTSVYPLGGQTGESVKLIYYSPATGDFTNELKLPARPSDKFGVFAQLDGLQAPTANWIRVSSFTNVLAEKENHDREHATRAPAAPPLALNGILTQPKQEDWFAFPCAKDIPLEVNVFARRLRSPLDSEIAIYDAAGKSIASNDDSAGPDSTLKFTPSESTNYFLRIRDTLGEGGRDFVYRVEVTPSEANIQVKIPEVARNDTQSRQYLPVPRGNRFATLISAKRANFKSDLIFSAPDLPAGIHLLSDPMPSGADSWPLVFEADTNAPIAGKLLDLTATGTNNSHTVAGNFSQDIELVPGPNNTVFYRTRVEKICAAVTKEAPFHLRVIEPKVPLVQNGSMRLEVVADRAPGFDEPIEVKMVWNPPGVSSQSEATIPKGATNLFYQLNANGSAEVRSWKLALLGRSSVEGGDVFVSTQLASLEIASPFVSGKIETLWLNPGKTNALTVNLQQLKPFEGKATIRLQGLPDKVTAAPKEFAKTNQEVVFDLIADPKCPLGSHKNLFCSVEIEQSGQAIPHTIASGGILRIVNPKKAETKVAAANTSKK